MLDVDGGLREAVSRRPSATNRALQALRQLLREDRWIAGDRLPSEPALAEELGVSRVSVRAALAQLQSEGLVDRRHGSGTYVNSVRPLVNSLHQNVGSDQLISSGGHTPGIAEMSWRLGSASEDVSARLGLEPGAAVVDLYRVRTSDGTPVTVEHDYFSAALLPPNPASLGASLYAFLSDVCGVDVAFGIAAIEPATAGAELAPVFGVSPDELLLVIKQVDYDADERPVSFSIEQHLASAFDFRLVRQGPAKGLSG
ncbi:GntR family transcriptional regulator [Sinomonas sp. G460-2]|uniref:GntR family transcriptional regulator n=1 Tax=Sinomonas sp. G460-2 TaxID=3393464 RepID=UPI0039EE43B2